MIKAKFTYAKKLSGLFASFTVLVCGGFIYSQPGAFDLNNLIRGLLIIVPAALTIGFLGYNIGKIFDGTKKKKSLTNLMNR